MAKILVLNSGSTFLNFKLYNSVDLTLLAFGQITGITTAPASYSLNDLEHQALTAKTFPEGLADHEDAWLLLSGFLKNYQEQIVAIGHLILRGSKDFCQTTIVNEINFESLAKTLDYSPPEQKVNLYYLQESLTKFKSALQFAIFDDTWYQTVPLAAKILPLPLAYYREHKIRRYGSDGVLHRQILNLASSELIIPVSRAKVITGYLDKTLSLVAVKRGQVLEFSGGFGKAEGLFGLTEAGEIDPEVIWYLQNKFNLSAKEAVEIFREKSGLVGLCGIDNWPEFLFLAGEKIDYTPKVKRLAEEKEMVKLAKEVVVYRLAKALAGLAGLLGQVEAVVLAGELSELGKNLIKQVLHKANLDQAQKIFVKTDLALALAQEVSAQLKTNIKK
ncbi:MAG: hypothetical protein WCW02_01015 [Candidatus Buchananbacteria bacterium]